MISLHKTLHYFRFLKSYFHFSKVRQAKKNIKVNVLFWAICIAISSLDNLSWLCGNLNSILLGVPRENPDVFQFRIVCSTQCRCVDSFIGNFIGH